MHAEHPPVFASSSLRNTCLSVLPASNVCSSIPTGLKHMGEAHNRSAVRPLRETRVCVRVLVCVCVDERNMPFSIGGQSERKKC